MIKDPWTIPFDGTTYVCWRKDNTPLYRKMTPAEEKNYFEAQNKEKYLHELLNS